MSDDVRVAEILGWTGIRNTGMSKVVNGEVSPVYVGKPVGVDSIRPLSRFTTDPAADYLVLEWVRKYGMDIQEVHMTFLGQQ